ncbi:MAG: hypothetical protein KatS3mg009_1623 [Acidimicrobiia bacterium]|nr:MAG: hypothetical protein KatS3mg009_1623 [Acidimicrobiia bacterium]
MTQLTLAERIVAIHESLHAVPHAFGGALALAYYAEPRATVDVDLNVFVPPDRYDDVAGPLAALGAASDDPSVRELVRRDGQARVIWDATPIDLFFAYDRFHAAAAAATRTVPFGPTTIPILSAAHLVVCKAVFDRPRDWVDVEAMLAAGAEIDVAEALRWVGRVTGDADPRYERLVAVLTRR